MSEKLVFSTDGGGKKKKQEPSKKAKKYSQAAGPAKMRLETKGRGGKSVTVLFNLPLSESDAKTLMREMQGALACGATMKASTIELRGDLRGKVEEFFAKKKMKIIRAGG